MQVSTTSIAQVESREDRLVLVVLVALPFILVRVTYSALAVFVHNHDFSVVDGSVKIVIAMAVVEDFVVVAIYVASGFARGVLARHSCTRGVWE